MKRILSGALLMGILWLIPVAVSAVSVLPVNLEGLVDKAGMIVDGTCISVDSKSDEQGLMATYITFEVHSAWKGQAPDTLTIKTYGGSKGALKAVVPGMPTFSPGERVLLFLHPASEKGFTSPVGMGQGRFKIFTGSDGKAKLVNDTNNQHLFRDMDWSRLEAAGAKEAARQLRTAQEPMAGPVDYETFKLLVETLIQTSRQ